MEEEEEETPPCYFKETQKKEGGGYKYEVKADFNPMFDLLLISRAHFRSPREQVGWVIKNKNVVGSYLHLINIHQYIHKYKRSASTVLQ